MTATSPHGLALAKARAKYNSLASAWVNHLHRKAAGWVQQTDCDGDCVKTGHMVISGRDQTFDWESANRKRATVWGSVSATGIIYCEEPKVAKMLEDGDIDVEIGEVKYGKYEKPSGVPEED